MSDTRDFSRNLLARIDTLVVAHTQQLIKSGAASHDKIAGQISGLALARSEILRETSNWFANADKEIP